VHVTVVTPPAAEPITLAEAKLQCRVTGSAEDALLEPLITAAREAFEAEANVALVTRTLRLTVDGFGVKPIRLPFPPAASISSVKYIDAAGVQQTLDAAEYVLDGSRQPAVLRTAYGRSWPTVRLQHAAVEVEYVAGFGGPADVPELAKAAIKLLLGHLFSNREAVTIGTIANETPLAYRRLVNLISRRGFA
jgi:uncharacterized phiE125 gp8 family phage protein